MPKIGKKPKRSSPVYELKSGVDKPRGYCLKCKKKGCVFTKGYIHRSPNGRFFYMGIHAKCGTKMSVVLSKTVIQGF